MFTRINVDDCENAVRYGGGAEGTVQFYDCDFKRGGDDRKQPENAGIKGGDPEDRGQHIHSSDHRRERYGKGNGSDLDLESRKQERQKIYRP